MFSDTGEERLARRIADLYATDPQFADARPSAAITAAIERPGLRLAQLVRTVMEGYADRPALGQRTVQFMRYPDTGSATLALLPQFETITYGQLWDRVRALATALAGDPVQPGDRVCVLGFTSIDYAIVDMALIQMAAVAVPMQTSAPVTQLQPIVEETEPSLIAASVDYLSDAVDLVLAEELTGHQPQRLVVFDYHPEVDDQRDALTAAGARLAQAGSPVVVDTLADVLDRGKALPAAQPTETGEDDPLTLLIYTSGSTGTPKGAMYPEHLVANFWRKSYWQQRSGEPAITLSFMPMSHVMGREVVYSTLGNGGTVYFAAKSDLSTLLDDLAWVRPTRLNFVPRVWDMIFQEFQSKLDRALSGGADRAAVEAEVLADLRQNLLGGRAVWAMTGSAPISVNLRAFVESLLDLHLTEGYGSTEAGAISRDGVVQRPPVIDYKLADVPDLGYFRTDQPHPRGELLVTSENLFAGYYHRPQVTAEVYDADGYYRTGDVVAEVGPDRLVYVDRRNNVIKLAQGEFVTTSKLEAVFETSPLIQQIYIYGNSTRAYPLAVIVPTDDALLRHGVEALKPMVNESLLEVAKAAGLQSYEIPRDFILETTPFTLANGLLTGIRKPARPKLKERYGERLEQLYVELAQGQSDELRALRLGGAKGPTLEAVGRAAAALLGAASADLRPDAGFTDLGGDSLSALTFANLLHDIFDIDVPVSVIISPASDLRAIADYIDTQRHGTRRPTFASVHSRLDEPVTEVAARELTLEKFIDAATLAAAPSLPGPSAAARTVLLTGATGFLGRYLALEWLERLSDVGGTLICLVRAKDDAAARERLDKTFDSGDTQLLAHYRELAADHLEVIAGDKAEDNLGLDPQTWQRLADTVDLIVDPAALVNHVLPYSQLFGPNVVGTSELIRIALTTRIKPFTYVSTIGVGEGIEPAKFTEDADIRVISPTRAVDESYANGYANSKWAGEVLLREAHDQFGLPVAVFRCDMILVDTRYAGQLNVPDMFTRLMLSLVDTGIAPASFYELDADGHRQRAHYDGLPVDFIAQAIATLGGRMVQGYQTYHVMNPYDDGIGLDEYVDWLVEAGYTVRRIPDYDAWLQRFDTAMRALPDKQRQHSLLPLLHNYQRPEKPVCGAIAPTDRFRAAVQKAEIGPDKDIPHVSAPIIVKYIANLQLLELL
ncbi:carboxylic acid reductase [Nocardia jiangxiensis]|uniref:carboxylic acid reductase n=1 Tax=Nocardia jiangxiensis TaxID=282685 RepID=UPI00059286C4|nr:carboxylic acid reductase [Nocardia jiangxiensis]